MNKNVKNNEKLNNKRIKDLCLDDFNCKITAVVMSKTDPHFFSKDDINVKGVLNITIRDSPKDYQNVTIWGSEEVIRDYDQFLQVGTVIDIIKPKIMVQNNNKAATLVPTTPSPFYLQVEEKRGEIIETTCENSASIKSYLRHPLKEASQLLQLSDVSNYMNEDPENTIYVDLLVALRYARPIREVTSKKGDTRLTRTLVVMDKSNPSMILQIWSTQLTKRSEAWTVGNTILYISDVKVKFSEYFDSMTLVETIKTIVIEDPIGDNAEELSNYVASTPMVDNGSIFGSHLVECKDNFLYNSIFN